MLSIPEIFNNLLKISGIQDGGTIYLLLLNIKGVKNILKILFVIIFLYYCPVEKYKLLLFSTINGTGYGCCNKEDTLWNDGL